MQEYAATPGNKGVQVLRMTEDGVTHFLLVTLWDSVDAIKRFAGDDYACARHSPADDEFLLERDGIRCEAAATVCDSGNTSRMTENGSFSPEDVVGCGAHAIIRWRYCFGPTATQSVRGSTVMRVRDERIVEALGYVKSGAPAVATAVQNATTSS